MKKLVVTILAVLFVSMFGIITSADSVTVDFNELIYPVGDVNCDETIDAADLVSLRKCLLGLETPKLIRTANVDKDSQNMITIKDLIRLKKAINEISLNQ